MCTLLVSSFLSYMPIILLVHAHPNCRVWHCILFLEHYPIPYWMLQLSHFLWLYRVLVWWWIINSSITAKIVEITKWVPRSLIITFGHPILDKTFSKWNFSYFPWFFKIILFYLCMRNSFFYSYIISFNSWWITS